MYTYLHCPEHWAQLEFGAAQLGDLRNNKRVMNIATHLAARPGGTLPQAFDGWAELKAAYRFFANPKNSFELIQAPHCARVLHECHSPGEYLLIEDTTSLSFNDRACEDLGYIRPGGRGFFLHSTLAVRVEAWDLNQRPEGVVLGLMAQKCWSRSMLRGKGTESRRALQERQRESQRWAAALAEAAPGARPTNCRWVLITDREGDFFEPMHCCLSRGIDFVIRGFHDRCLGGQDEHYLELLAQAPVVGTTAVELRARPGQSARTAVLEVRCLRHLSLRGPYRAGRKMADFTVNALEVREAAPPPGVPPLHWVLLSSLSCERWPEIQQVIGRYCARWWVEEYHKALKTGAGAQESQLAQQHRLEALVAVLAVVAVRLLNLKFLARTQPDQAVDPAVFGAEALRVVEARFGKSSQGAWTHRELLRAVARMGGFIGRRSDGEPGWQTIWRGWQRLMWMAEGVELIQRG